MMSDINCIPTPQVLSEASSLEILDINGKNIRFGSLFESEKAAIVFIRKLVQSFHLHTYHLPLPRSFLLRCALVSKRDNVGLRTEITVMHIVQQTCQEYVKQLASISQEALAQAKTKIIVIGCGDWQPIRSYLGIYSIFCSVTEKC